MNCPLPNKKLWLLLSLLFIITSKIQSQVTGKLTLLPDGETFQVAIIPNQTLEAPNNITNTGQITLKATAGSVAIKDFHTNTGIWQFNTRINQPTEAPTYDYLIFNLVTPLVNPKYEAGIEVVLFNFKNANGCIGTIELLENRADIFWPPNSANANIGNQLTIFGFGLDNAYQGNDVDNNKIVCPSQLDFSFRFDPIKCVDRTTEVSLYFKNGLPPFQYVVQLENGTIIKDSLLNRGDSVKIQIPKGHHSITGFNIKDTIIDHLFLPEPEPLVIEIVAQEKVLCEDTNGATVQLSGTGGISTNTYQFKWSNGAIGAKIDGLNTGVYNVTLSNEHNCTALKEIIIENAPVLSIDSIKMYPPHCFGDSDGLIEVVSMKQGTPPFRYAINKSSYQATNYFEDLPADEYQINITDASNCRANKVVFLNNPPKLEITTTSDTTLLKGQSLQLMPKVSVLSNLIYSWASSPFLSCTDCPTPIVHPTETSTFSLTVSNEFGCEAIASQKIIVIAERPVYIPSIFSPNGDGINDIFEIHIGPTIKKILSLKIFNRWGQLIYHGKKTASNESLKWDGTHHGKQVASGTYIFFAEIQLEDDNYQIYKGDFFLLK